MNLEFNYENVDPETLKEWEREYRNKCRREMTQYLKTFLDATPEEKRHLSSWVRSGHSPYENGWYIANDSGGPMDFISAMRFLDDEYQAYLENPDGYYGCCSTPESPDGNKSCTADSGENPPF